MVILVNHRGIYLILLIIVLFGLGVGSSLFIFSPEENLLPVTANKDKLSGKEIVVDPGHGGIDGGSSHGNLLEKEINLTLARRLKEFLTNKGMTVKLTRSQDQSLDHLNDKYNSRHRRDLQARVDIIEAENPDLFISLHVNYFAGRSSNRGPICFYQTEKKASKQLAQAVQAQLNCLEVQGQKLPDNSSRAGDYFLLNNCRTTGALIELGFINQADDRKLLTNQQAQQKLIQSIYRGLIDFYQPD